MSIDLPPKVLAQPLDDGTSLLTHARNGALGLGFAGAIVSLLRHNQIITIFRGEFSRVNIFHAAIYVYLFYLGILWYYCGIVN
jgi:hypothetical protein